MDAVATLLIVGVLVAVFWLPIRHAIKLSERMQDPRPWVRNRWPWEK